VCFIGADEFHRSANESAIVVRLAIRGYQSIDAVVWTTVTVSVFGNPTGVVFHDDMAHASSYPQFAASFS